MKRVSLNLVLGVVFLAILAYIIYMLGGFGSVFSGWGGSGKVITNHNVVLEKIENLGKMELVRYKFKDIYEYIEEGVLMNESVGIIVSGEAVGCIDLKKVNAKDIKNTKDSIYIKMPSPELCFFKINHKDSRIFNSTYLRFNASDLYGKAFKKAEAFIEEVAKKSDILERTKENAEKILKPLLEEISKKKVKFVYEFK